MQYAQDSGSDTSNSSKSALRPSELAIGPVGQRPNGKAILIKNEGTILVARSAIFCDRHPVNVCVDDSKPNG